jgi:hypothetical protein
MTLVDMELLSKGSVKAIDSGIKIIFLNAPIKDIKKRKNKPQKKIDSLTEFLFSDDKDDEDDKVGYLPIELEQKEIEKVHHIFIQSLINMYEKLRK